MSATDQLFVRSHVARDLLQNAGLFKTDKLVVWEYEPTVFSTSALARIQSSR